MSDVMFDEAMRAETRIVELERERDALLEENKKLRFWLEGLLDILYGFPGTFWDALSDEYDPEELDLLLDTEGKDE